MGFRWQKGSETESDRELWKEGEGEGHCEESRGTEEKLPASVL